MKTLQEMTSKELVRNREHWVKGTHGLIHSINAPEAIKSIEAELDSRCEKAGIRKNIDGSFSVQPFTLSIEEAGERAALISYIISKP